MLKRSRSSQNEPNSIGVCRGWARQWGRGRRGGGTAEHSHGLSPSTAAPSAEDAHSKQEPQNPARSPRCSAGGDWPSFCFIFFYIKRGIKKSLKKILIALMFVTRGTLRGLRKQRGGAERGSEQQGHNQAGPNAVHTVLRRAALSALLLLPFNQIKGGSRF